MLLVATNGGLALRIEALWRARRMRGEKDGDSRDARGGRERS